jgi:hypothetical protein
MGLGHAIDCRNVSVAIGDRHGAGGMQLRQIIHRKRRDTWAKGVTVYESLGRCDVHDDLPAPPTGHACVSCGRQK